jgi:hypothetical protein
MISLEEPSQVVGLNEIRADLENLTLSEGVRNMSPNLPGMLGSLEVVYEYSKSKETLSVFEDSSAKV